MAAVDVMMAEDALKPSEASAPPAGATKAGSSNPDLYLKMKNLQRQLEVCGATWERPQNATRGVASARGVGVA